MEKKKSTRGKITLAMLKGKPINSSVPSLAIRFNATAEEIEELHVSDSEQADNFSTTASCAPSTPKIVNRSTSVDVSSVADASPPSDPWRFFSDIKGKITKSVEGKLTEYKHRTGDSESSPKTSKGKDNGGKDSSSLSDSEEISESSISRTCGIVSTTEGAELSSDEDDSHSSKDNPKTPDISVETPSDVKKKVKVVGKNAKSSDHYVSSGFLENLQNINMGIDPDQSQSQSTIEHGIDVLQIDNIEMDGDELLINQVSGEDIKRNYYAEGNISESTMFSPSGFVDLRVPKTTDARRQTHFEQHKWQYLVLASILFYFTFPLSPYLHSFLTGCLVTATFSYFYVKLATNILVPVASNEDSPKPIYEIPAIKEYQPPTKYESWVNEFPDKYDPSTYNVSKTQSVYLKLQGNLLKVSHTRLKIPKRAMWNEPEHKHSFTRHRIYNLYGATVKLLPQGLTRLRHWSKKYPICITLDSNQLGYDYHVKKKKNEAAETKKRTTSPLLFSKLAEQSGSDADGEQEEEVYENCTNGDPSDTEYDAESIGDINEDEQLTSNVTTEKAPQNDDPSSNAVTCLYFFTRTCREKEHWFKKLTVACKKKSISNDEQVECENDVEAKAENGEIEKEYIKAMAKFMQFVKNDAEEESENNVWLNTLLTRVLFDFTKNAYVQEKIRERIQKKLTAIKLPYFIQELSLTELSLGNSIPSITKASRPTFNEFGVWVDLDINYDGTLKLILQTKLDLMKLKNPPAKCDGSRSAMFHSDVEDSAESSTEDESLLQLQQPQHQIPDGSGTPSGNKSKRFMKMVDRIAESKIFQAATDYKFIKKAMEGVSNTELRLVVEIRTLKGTLSVNIPPPPSDRIWLGFKPTPTLVMQAVPIVGERNINLLSVTSWIEKTLYKEFLKLLVIPNMEDIFVPVMLHFDPV